MQGYGAYQQAKGQQKALGHAIGQAKKIPGMIEESYAPGLERYGDLETQYGHQGAVHQSLMRNLTGAFNQQIGQVDPSMRKMLSRGNVQKGVQAMEQMLPAFAQQQQNIAGTLTGMEQQKGQELIGAHENLAQLQAARKSINPTASALGSFGASLMSMVQGGGKVKKQGGDETYTPYSSYDAGKQIINEELIKKGYTAENYPEIAGIIKSNRMNNPGEVSDELRNRPVSPSDIAGYLGTNIESSSEDSIYNQNIRGTSAYEDIYEKKIKATIPQLDDEYGWYDTVRQKDTGGTYGKRTEYDEDFAPIIGGTPMLEGVTVSAPRKKADGGYISGPHHGAGGVDISPNVEAQGGEFVVNANSYNKHKSLIDAVNMDDNEMTIMNSYFGDKHSAHGNMMQGGGELNSNEMTPYQKYLVVRGNKPSEFSDEHAFNRGLENYMAKKQGSDENIPNLFPLVMTNTGRKVLNSLGVDNATLQAINEKLTGVYSSTPLSGEDSPRSADEMQEVQDKLFGIINNPLKAKKQGGDINKTLYDTHVHSKQMSPTDYGGYDAKLLMSIPADQVGGDEGRRWYLGEGESKLMGLVGRKAEHQGRMKMASNPSDSLTTQQAMEMFPSYFGIEPEAPTEKQGLLKRMFRKKQSGGNVMGEGTLINKIINNKYGM